MSQTSENAVRRITVGARDKAMSSSGSPSEVLPNVNSTPEKMAEFVVGAAINAPSVLNTQPWWFHGVDREIGLHFDTEHKLPVADPDGREMLISCGAALFTARVALRYLGIVPVVRLLPDPDRRALVARIRWTDTAAVTEHDRDLFASISRRRTHHGGFDSETLPQDIVKTACDEAAFEHATLRVIGYGAQRNALAAVTEAGEYAVRHNVARIREQARWSGAPGSRRRNGGPATAYPARPDQAQPLEIPELREFTRSQFCEGEYPQMLLRFGTVGATGESVRRPVKDVLL